jgi:hypothetical protein
MKKNTIQLEDLNTLAGYQESCKNYGPTTTIAAFKIEDMEELIAFIKEKRGKESGDLIYNICVTFIREKTDENGKFDNKRIKIYGGNPSMTKVAKESKIGFTQVIPVITGCVLELEYNGTDNEYQTRKFKYLENGKDVIPFVAPGGEGSGLIPPPPTGKGQ